MKLNFILTGMVTMLSLISCNTQKTSVNTNSDTHSSQNAVDWDGVYTGTVPCADCEGINTMINLNKDMTYVMETKYMGKSNETFKSKGTFSWDKSGSNISLNGESGISKYKVGENKLFQLDRKGKLISGNLANNYILTKETNTITEKYWKLTEINGKAISPSEQSEREAHFVLRTTDNRITGNSGCNSFSGSYNLQAGNRIRFSNIASTRMACVNMSIEDQLFEVLSTVDNYTMNEDVLTLNRARMAPLARFEAVYLK